MHPDIAHSQSDLKFTGRWRPALRLRRPRGTGSGGFRGSRGSRAPDRPHQDARSLGQPSRQSGVRGEPAEGLGAVGKRGRRKGERWAQGRGAGGGGGGGGLRPGQCPSGKPDERMGRRESHLAEGPPPPGLGRESPRPAPCQGSVPGCPRGGWAPG